MATFESYENRWIKRFNLLDESKFTLYVNSFYFSIVVAFTVGYGDIYATNYREMVFIIGFLFIGIAVYSYSLSKMISLFEEIAKKDNYLREKENSVKEFCRNHNLPKGLYLEIKNFLLDNDSKQNSYFSHIKVVHDFREITEKLPGDLNQYIYYDVLKDKILTVPLFKGLINQKFFVFLCSLIEIRYINMNEVIFKPGDIAKEIFIVWSGSLTMYNSLILKDFEEYLFKKSPSFTIKKRKQKDDERKFYSIEKQKIMTFFNANDIFGENDVWKHDGMIRKFTIRANTDCVLFVLRKSDIKYLFELDSEFKLRLEQERLRKESVIKFILDLKTNNKSVIEEYQNFLKKKDRKIVEIVRFII